MNLHANDTALLQSPATAAEYRLQIANYRQRTCSRTASNAEPKRSSRARKFKSTASSRGISPSIARNSTAASFAKVRWGSANPTWTAGGTRVRWTSFFTASFAFTWTKHRSPRGRRLACTFVLCSSIPRENHVLSKSAKIIMTAATICSRRCSTSASNLDEAQQAKLEFVCRAIDLQPCMKVLDIGCGWGSFAKYAAEKYGARVVGITISREQAKLAAERCAGLPVEIRVQDYRDLQGQFDCVVSLGMFEHVGYKNYRSYMNIVRHALSGCGRFYLGCIGKNCSVRATDPWIEKYIFPNSMIPSLKQVGAAAEGLFILENFQNWAAHYDRTLMAWFHNFETHWNELRRRYDERFFRMWKFYLMASAGSFRSGSLQAWQMLFSPEGAGGC